MCVGGWDVRHAQEWRNNRDPRPYSVVYLVALDDQVNDHLLGKELTPHVRVSKMR
jgi:hypothetical protein